MFDLTDKIVVITGGTGVLGQTIVRGLDSYGAKIAILGRNAEKGMALAGELRDAIFVSCDVLDKASILGASQTVMDKWGRVDALINGAGGNHAGATVTAQTSFFDLPLEAIQHVFNVNFTGTFLTSQVFGKLIASQKHGVILNISSMSAVRPLSRVVAYGNAKAALDNLTQWLAVHFATEYGQQLRVNGIAPGFFLTEQNRFLLTEKSDPNTLTQRGKTIIAHTPMGRFGDPDDLIGTVIWLLSDASKFVTGVVVPVDGGFSANSGV
jgi:NAD(P)-dependent dehydrogenase (short-subunit alcohol dehydrogenase family)